MKAWVSLSPGTSDDTTSVFLSWKEAAYLPLGKLYKNFEERNAGESGPWR